MKRTNSNWGRTIFPALFIVAIAVLLVLPFRKSPAANPSLINSNFETGPFFNEGTVTGWTVSANVADNAEGATSGTHSAALGAGGDFQGDTLAQSFTTTSGTTYALDFDAGIFGTRSGAPLQVKVEVLGSGNLLTQFITPPEAGTFDPGQTSFQHYHFTFQANSSSSTLRFTALGTGNGSADQVIDTVTITEQSSTPSQDDITICDAVTAFADNCFTLAMPPCLSGFALFLPNADCSISFKDCLQPGPAAGSDGFKYVFSPAGTFTENATQGTATLTGHLESSLHPGYGFDVNITFSGRTNINAMPIKDLDAGCYKPAGPVDIATWHFYSTASGALIGTGNYTGAILQLNSSMKFQVGPNTNSGASGKNVKPGSSGWFTWTVLSQPGNHNFCLRSSVPNGPTADFSFNCENPRKPGCDGVIGDFVWLDTNGNGCQDANEPGMNGVTVDLFSGCDANKTLIGTTTTDQNGHYQFTGLCAGNYSVCFHTPSGFSHTVNNPNCSVGGKPSSETDSNCLQSCGDLCCVCVTLVGDHDSNLTIDCGYIPNCALTVTKSCSVPSATPSATAFSCSNMKPISSISMIWNGTQTINIKAWRGTPGTVLLSTQNGITPGQKVTVSGYTGTPNDVQWEIFDAATGNKIGTSDFHLSCSDVDMNGPEDCGKAEGDAKGLSGFINTWIFAGMSGANGITIDCGNGGTGGNGGTTCNLVPGKNPDCTTAGKPTTLTFQYTGGGCAASNNPQSGKFICSGSVNTGQSITLSTTTTGLTISPTTVSPGGFFTVSAAAGKTFPAQTALKLTNGGGTENLSIHTSCSQILAVGNVFGDITLTGFNGKSGANSVNYHYEVKNNGGTTLTNIFLTDNQLGQIAGPFSLNAGQTMTFNQLATVPNGTTTNVATANVQGGNCTATSNTVTVTVSPTPTPTPTPQTGNCTTNGRPNQLKMTYTSGSCASSQNSQGPPNFSVCQKFCCTESNGGLTGASPVHIIVSSSSTTPATGSQRFFEGDVATGSQFTVNSGSSTFGANTYFYIYEGGVLKQKVQMHTSCSAPLIRGETFGGVRLDDYAIVP